METSYLLIKIVERYPNKLPTKEISPYELGRLAGQQDVIEYIKTVTKAEDPNEGDELTNK